MWRPYESLLFSGQIFHFVIVHLQLFIWQALLYKATSRRAYKQSFFKLVKVAAVRMEAGSSFHQRETE